MSPDSVLFPGIPSLAAIRVVAVRIRPKRRGAADRGARGRGARRRDARGRDAQIEELESRILMSTYSPLQIRQAYGFNNIYYTVNGQSVRASGQGQTIAIVDAYDDPTIAADLQSFDADFGFGSKDPNGNFVLTKATPEGMPQVDAGWAMEISLDVEYAHAIAPKADILLVEAKSSSFNDLIDAVNWASEQPGVDVVSMSWGIVTTPGGHIGDAGLAGGVTYVTSSGDSGAGTSYPANSPNVLAVGGTSLSVDQYGNYIGESAWSGSGGGYSRIERTDSPDVAYDANPNTGYYIWDTTSLNGSYGWVAIGGTSAGAPQWAALIADVDQGRSYLGLGSLDGATQTIPAIYAAPSADFHDITTGSNGYAAAPGYDLATGLGTPIANLLVPTLIQTGVTSSARLTTTSAPVAAQTAFRISPSIFGEQSVAASQNAVLTGSTQFDQPNVFGDSNLDNNLFD
jgi:subtilase family serine protease